MAVPSVSQWSGSLGFCHWIPYLLQHRPSWPSVSTAPLHRSKSGRHSLVSNGASRAVLARSQKISKVLQHFSRDTAYLASHFNRASTSRLFELQKPMVDYSREIKNICDQLSSIGNTVSEHMKIRAALLGLGRDYEPIKTSIEGSMDVHNCLGRSRENNFFSTRGRGFPKYISSAPSSRSSDYEDSESRHVYQICGKPCHVAMGCWHKFDNSYQMDEMHSAFAAQRISDFSDVAGHEWFPDTGASAHITNSPLHLQKRSALSWVRLCHTGPTSIASSSGKLHVKDFWFILVLLNLYSRYQSSQKIIHVVLTYTNPVYQLMTNLLYPLTKHIAGIK